MTKQEEIREGIKDYVLEIRQHLCNTEFALPPFDDEPLDPNWMWGFTDQILSYLHSQGVVIKVDRERPNCDSDWNCPLDEDGYVAVEPLIKKDV